VGEGLQNKQPLRFISETDETLSLSDGAFDSNVFLSGVSCLVFFDCERLKMREISDTSKR
jgi:hypothetical protein